MRKVLVLFIVTVLVLSLTACGNHKTDVNTISDMQLTEREKTFLSTGNSAYFVFDFNVDEHYQWAEFWVDEYELGKKVNSSKILSSGLTETENGMIVVTVDEPEKMKQHWTIVVKNDGAAYTGTLNQEYTRDEKTSFGKTWGTSARSISIDDNEIVLASICYTKGNAMSGLSDAFYSDPNENMEEIVNYDLAYLLRCKFYKDNPHQ